MHSVGLLLFKLLVFCWMFTAAGLLCQFDAVKRSNVFTSTGVLQLIWLTYDPSNIQCAATETLLSAAVVLLYFLLSCWGFCADIAFVVTLLLGWHCWWHQPKNQQTKSGQLLISRHCYQLLLPFLVLLWWHPVCGDIAEFDTLYVCIAFFMNFVRYLLGIIPPGQWLNTKLFSFPNDSNATGDEKDIMICSRRSFPEL